MTTNLQKYIKSEKPEKLDSVNRSVNIERTHQDFLNNNNLNLSKLVRDFLDSIMKGEKKND